MKAHTITEALAALQPLPRRTNRRRHTRAKRVATWLACFALLVIVTETLARL